MGECGEMIMCRSSRALDVGEEIWYQNRLNGQVGGSKQFMEDFQNQIAAEKISIKHLPQGLPIACPRRLFCLTGK